MKAVILAGGFGSRISEETQVRPKPMVEIGGKPILWHIMKIYSAHGINDFIVCRGYKGYMIKEYFANYFLHTSDVTFDLARERSRGPPERSAEPWRVTLVDTGETTMTGGRLQASAATTSATETFCFTYGDGVADVDIGALVEFHREQAVLATVTAVQPPGRFGALEIDGDAGHAVSREAGGRRRLDQRRLLRALARGRRATSTGTRRSGSVSRSRRWRATGSCRPTSTPGSGSPWTRCATCASCRRSGTSGRRAVGGSMGVGSRRCSGRTWRGSTPNSWLNRA